MPMMFPLASYEKVAGLRPVISFNLLVPAWYVYVSVASLMVLASLFPTLSYVYPVEPYLPLAVTRRLSASYGKRRDVRQ